MTPPADATTAGRARTPIDRIGATVLNELVQSIVTAEYAPGDLLPPESVISVQFGASRPVLREPMQRLQENGMAPVAQGRRTPVHPPARARRAGA